jgi:iron-sulfur cluster assembly accessory protein
MKKQSVTLTQHAAHQLKSLQKKASTQPWGLRFSTKPGLCGSGYEYMLDIAAAPDQQDVVFLSRGVSIYVPQENLKMLEGSVIEYRESDPNAQEGSACEVLAKKGFFILNPNVKGPCPCACHKGVDL